MGEESVAVRGTNEVVRDIASTRRRIEERADALRDRMSTKELVRPVTDRLKATFGAGGEKILDAFRDNPVPLALVGVGIGWLMLRDSGMLGRGGDARRSAESALRSVGEGAREAAHSVGDAAGAMSGKVSDVAHQTKEAAQQARAAVRRGASSTAEWFDHRLNDNPLALAISALAAGLVAGLAIPVTEKEREALGKLGEQVAQKVLEKGPEAKAETSPAPAPSAEPPQQELPAAREIAPASPAGQPEH
jgi:hypothetical protein